MGLLFIIAVPIYIPVWLCTGVHTDMHVLTTGLRYEKSDFVVVGTCTYTNLDSTVQPTKHLVYMV